ncbi:MAG: hypothetical protein QOE90_2901 [Thermoplasmata archaeon]|nr:hypothetical protein [Thermoplasmata archaeon]
MLDALAPFLAWDLSAWEVYGLFFLLGSFVVATLSDVKHLSAQREFMDVWWAFAVLMLAIQLYAADWRPELPFYLKWGLVLVGALLSHRTLGLWLRLATADVAAIVAAASLFPPLLVVAFFVLLKLLAWPAARLLARGRPAYPFMPVVTVATLLLIALALFSGGL